MIVHYCDLCTARLDGKAITVGYGYKEFSLCLDCGKPMASFLRRSRLSNLVDLPVEAAKHKVKAAY